MVCERASVPSLRAFRFIRAEHKDHVGVCMNVRLDDSLLEVDASAAAEHPWKVTLVETCVTLRIVGGRVWKLRNMRIISCSGMYVYVAITGR